MKVAVFIAEELPSNGGSYTFTSEIINSLIKLASESSHTFLVFGWQKEIPQQFLGAKNICYISLWDGITKSWLYGLNVILNTIFQKLRYPKTKFKIENWYENFILLRPLQKHEIDIIWNICPYSLTTKIPNIVTVWDLQHRMQPYFPEVSTEGWKWDEREQYYLKTLKRASFIITGTNTAKTEIERFYEVPSERIKVLPLPTPQFALNPALRNDKSIRDKYNLTDEYLYYPAQFWPHKNHANLLLAVKLLKDKYDLKFSVVFTGSDKGNKEYIREMAAKLDISLQVHFLGFIPQEDLISLYQNAFALTFVTFFGPDNLPPLEAFALGCPVVASKVSGATEQLQDAALLVDPKNPEDIALAIKSLWDDISLRQTLVQRGFLRASQWSQEDYVKGIFSILDEFATIRRCWGQK
ncbi:MAG: glycosyltransferase family 4 protein [Cyanomargarita calcarea GSE-NOS-MK-12-04C]|jgi:glycosyltransferase involved in cell wall biosynthesis|uniref:Glycosyltransferase family 4 protein n=1 Tax=Cyanomargarita calcarea GSE-NOS-MK-12-04C TaxID=2839659 RepID=A0A951UTI3_9CYAN|nr:glycosyltransferase family 4 protein [Cyanomargarita calcarea GSE-NOS-MK-12-04C]